MVDDNSRQTVIASLRAAAATTAPGTRLPSVRQITASHRVSPVTVQRAVAALVAEGLLETRPGAGTFVAARPPATTADAPDLDWQAVALGRRSGAGEALKELLAVPAPGVIALSAGYPDPSLHAAGPLGAALARAARRPQAWLRTPSEGLPALRAWFAGQVTGAAYAAEDVVICPGGQAALATVCRALARPGEAIIVESPTYVGAMAAARAADLTPVGVPVDDGGVRPDLLTAALERTGAPLVYLQPLYGNPHGAVLAPERRLAVLDAAARAGAFVVEDDWARDLVLDGRPPPPLAADDRHGHVVHIRSLTKTAAPALRIAALAARGAAGARLAAARVVDDLFVAGPLQEAVLDLVGSPSWRRHVGRLGAELRVRRDTLRSAIARDLPDWRLVRVPHGGLHLWVRLPAGLDDQALTMAAAGHGVLLFPGRSWFPGEPPAPHLRLSYCGADPEGLREGVRRLAAAARELQP